jgi:hypothetical protein
VVNAALFFDVVLLSQATGWRDMGRRFRAGGNSFDPTSMLLVLTAIFVIVLVLWLLVRFFQREGEGAYRSPWRLFIELCRAHQLRWSEGWLLWRLAQSQQLSQPAIVFVEPECFNAASLPPNLQRKQERLSALRKKLFGSATLDDQ